ncbi:MAG: aa3-type cytochrome c oxidase subunit IV [Hyphomicrobiaceae bacterium]
MNVFILDELRRNGDDYASHLATYEGFVRGVMIFTAHVAVILLLLAWWLV